MTILTKRRFGLASVDTETGQTRIRLMNGGEIDGPTLTHGQTVRAVEWIREGPTIQEALWDLGPDVRELFLSGITSKEWNKEFGGDE